MKFLDKWMELEAIILSEVRQSQNFHSSPIYSSQKLEKPRCPAVDEWIQKCGIFTQWSTTQLSETMTL